MPTFALSHFATFVTRAVTVQDANGQPVGGLSAASFTVTQDGIAQRVVGCEFEDFARLAPGGLAAAPANEITSEAPGSPRYSGRRLLIFYFDLPTMPVADQDGARAAALEFVGSEMAPPDAVAVLARNTGELRILSDFTDDRASLSAAIREAFKGPDPRAPRSAGEIGLSPDLTTEQLRFFRLQQAVKLFAQIYERKAFLYFASHIAHEDPANRALTAEISNAANREVLSLYPIETASGGRDTEAHSETFAKLASATAGAALLEGGDLTAAIARVEHANSSHYLIQYWADERENAGRDFHAIRISLKGASGALSYQGGYYRDRRWRDQNAEEQLREALLSGDPPTELPLSIEIGQARPIEDKYGVTVKVTIPASAVFAASIGPEPPTFDFAAEVKDGDRVVQALRESVTIEPRRGPGAAPLRYQHLFELAPGTYALRLVARSAAYYGVMGTYSTTISVSGRSSGKYN
jgi:VWFA-related protein